MAGPGRSSKIPAGKPRGLPKETGASSNKHVTNTNKPGHSSKFPTPKKVPPGMNSPGSF